jgi:hypothetical protein
MSLSLSLSVCLSVCLSIFVEVLTLQVGEIWQTLPSAEAVEVIVRVYVVRCALAVFE